MRLNSIRARMTLGFVLGLAPFLLVTCLVLVLVSTRLDAALTQRLLRQTVMQAQSILLRPDLGWRDELADLTAEPGMREHEVGLLVLEGQRVVWRSSDELPTRPVVSGSAWQVAVRQVGPLRVFALHPGPERTARRDHLLSELLTLSLCVTVAAAAGAWALVGWTLRPIHQLSRQSDVASTERLGVQLTAPSQDAEIVELVGTLNGLLARQAQTAAAKGRFYAAASHELRTPLQALSGHLELALSRPRAPEDYKAALDEAQGQTRRLTALVRALLLLHQLEGTERPPQEPTDLTTICDNALALIHPRLSERGLHLTAQIAEGVVIQAAPTHAQMLVRNLLENAVRYTTAGGQVSAMLTHTTGGVCLKVSNDCVLPDDENPQAWLEPFHRPDHARAANTGGNGLGLAICRALADANGWQIQILRQAPGVVAEVAFPR